MKAVETWRVDGFSRSLGGLSPNTVAAYVTVKPMPGFHIKAELNGVRATVSGTRVNLLDSRVQLEMYVAHVVGFFAGYRQFRFDVVDKDYGSVENTFKGPYAGVGLKF